MFFFHTLKYLIAYNPHTYIYPLLNIQTYISTSADKTVKVWNSSNGSKYSYSEACSFDMHTSDITSVDSHPVNNFVISTSKDGSWALSDADAG